MDDLREVIARAVWDSGPPMDSDEGMKIADAALAAIKQAANEDMVRSALKAIDREDEELYELDDLLAFFRAMIEASNG